MNRKLPWLILSASLTLIGFITPAPGQDEAAPDPAPIIIPLGDHQRELVLLPRPEQLEMMNWSADTLERNTTDLLRAREAGGDLSPDNLAFDTSFFGLAVEESKPLTELAAVSIRPLTLEPAEAMRSLVDALGGEDRGRAQAALEQLQKLRGRAGQAVPMLIEALKTASPAQVHFLRSAIQALGPHAAEAVPVLVERFKASENDKRGYALALASIGEKALPALRDLAAGDAPADRAEAGRALVRIGPAGEALVREALGHADADVRRDAAGVLGEGRTTQTTSALGAALNDRDSAVRLAAIGSLGRQGPRAEPAVEPLLTALRDKDPAIQSAAIDALGRIHRRAQAVVPALVPFLAAPPADPTTAESPGPSAQTDALCVAALDAMSRFGTDAAPAADAITACLDRSPTVRQAALAALENLGPAALPALSAAMRLMIHEDAKVSLGAYRLLAAMGPAASPALNKLTAALDGPRGVEAAWALACIGPKAKRIIPRFVALASGQRADASAPVGSDLALAGIDAGGAVAALDAALRVKTKVKPRGADTRQALLDAIRSLQSKADHLRAAAESAETAKFGQSARPQGFAKAARVLTPGDPLVRVVALLGPPDSTRPGELVYLDTAQDGERTEIAVAVGGGAVKGVAFKLIP